MSTPTITSPKITALGYVLLGVLSTKDRTGWEIARHLEAPIGFMWAARHSQIYPELNRLAQAGLIVGTVIKGRGPRDTKRYAITNAGRDVLAAWADSPLPPPRPRAELLLRIRALWLVSPERAVAFLTSQRDRFAAELAVLEGERAAFAVEDLGSVEHPEFFAYATLVYGLDQTRAQLDWCDWLLDQVRRALRGEPVSLAATV